MEKPHYRPPYGSSTCLRAGSNRMLFTSRKHRERNRHGTGQFSIFYHLFLLQQMHLLLIDLYVHVSIVRSACSHFLGNGRLLFLKHFRSTFRWLIFEMRAFFTQHSIQSAKDATQNRCYEQVDYIAHKKKYFLLIYIPASTILVHLCILHFHIRLHQIEFQLKFLLIHFYQTYIMDHRCPLDMDPILGKQFFLDFT